MGSDDPPIGGKDCRFGMRMGGGAEEEGRVDRLKKGERRGAVFRKLAEKKAKKRAINGRPPLKCNEESFYSSLLYRDKLRRGRANNNNFFYNNITFSKNICKI